MDGVAVSSVMFGDGVLNIQYVEGREQTRTVMVSRSMSIDMEAIPEKVEQLAELLEDIVDEGLVLLRNPPKRVRRPSVSYDFDELDEDDV